MDTTGGYQSLLGLTSINSNSSTIDILNVENITINGVIDLSQAIVGGLTTSQVDEGLNLYYTDTRVNNNSNVSSNTTHRDRTDNPHAVTATQVGIDDTDDISEGVTNLYYTDIRFDDRLATKTTTSLTEGSNLYYTDVRFDTRLLSKTTTDLAEGTNLYYTDARFDTRFAIKTTTDLTEGTNLYYTDARFDTRLSIKTTTDLAEGANLYYTEARVSANTDVKANTAYRNTGHLPLAGGILTGNLNMGNYDIDNVNQVFIDRNGLARNKLVLYDGGSGSTTTFYRFGIQNSTLLYNVDGTGANHKFYYGGTNELFRIGNAGIYSYHNLIVSGAININGEKISRGATIGLQLYGASSNLAGPHLQAFVSTDTYPVFQQLNWSHNNVNMTFDSYYDGSWRSSSTSSNLLINKASTSVNFNYDSGIALGSAISWNTGLSMNTTNGLVSCNNGLNVTGNITVSATVDGVDVAALNTTANNHIANTNNPHGVLASQITDFDTEVSDNTDVKANTAKVSADGSINTHSDVSILTVQDQQFLKYSSFTQKWANVTPTTAMIAEHDNLYYTDARFDTRLATKTTTDLAEGTNLYYTEARFDTSFGVKKTTDLTEGINLYYTEARVSANTDVNANTAYRNTGHLPLSGGTLTGDLSMGNYKIISLATPTADTDGANKKYIDDKFELYEEGKVLAERYSIATYANNTAEMDARFNGLTPNASQYLTNLYTVGWSGEQFGVIYNCYLYVPTAGNITFRVRSDDSSDWFIDDALVASNYGGHAVGGGVVATSTVFMTAGFHKSFSRFIEQSGGEGMIHDWDLNGGSTFTTIPTANIFIPGVNNLFDTQNITSGTIITTSERANIATNNAKISYPSVDSTKVGFISVTQAVDLDTMESNIATNNNKVSYPSADSTKVEFISVTQAVDLDAMESDITTNNNKVSYPSADSTKVGFISVTQAVNLDTMESDIATNNNKVSASGSINTHSDVNITSPVDGHLLTYTSGEWKNLAPAEVTGYLPLDGTTAMTGALSIDPSNHGEKVVFYETTPTEVPYGIQTSNGYIMHGVEYNGSHVFIYDIDGKLATAGYMLQLSRLGLIMNTELSMNNHKITDLTTPTDAADASTKGYVDTAVNAKLSVNGTSIMIGNLNMGNYDIDNVNQVFINRSGLANNKLVLLDNGSGSTTDFYGFGIQAATLMYNINSTGANHKFYYAGIYELFRIGHDGVYSYRNLDITGNITVSGTVDGIDIQSLNTTVGGKLSLTGGTMSGNLNMGNQDIDNVNQVFVNRSGLANNKLVLYDGGSGSTTSFYGLGIQSSTLLYNVDGSSANHRFYYGGTNEVFRIGNAGVYAYRSLGVTGNISMSTNSRILINDGTNSACGIRWVDENHAVYCFRAANQMYIREYGAIYFQTTGENTRAYINSSGLTNLSDRRKKSGIREMKCCGLDLINALKPVCFTHIGAERENCGFIAQDIEELVEQKKICFNPVSDNRIEKEDGSVDEFKGLCYIDFIAPLVKAVQELSAEVKTLKNRIEILESPII